MSTVIAVFRFRQFVYSVDLRVQKEFRGRQARERVVAAEREQVHAHRERESTGHQRAQEVMAGAENAGRSRFAAGQGSLQEQVRRPTDGIHQWSDARS